MSTPEDQKQFKTAPDAQEVNNKSTLIQHTVLPDADTLKESPKQQVKDTARADLFSYKVFDGVESLIMRDNITAFNQIRMQGDLYAPVMPEQPSTLGALGIRALPVIEGMPKVRAAIQKDLQSAEKTASLIRTKNYLCTSEVVAEICPYGLSGRRNTPFIPINTLQPGFSVDTSLNGIQRNPQNLQLSTNQQRFPMEFPNVKTTPLLSQNQQMRNMNINGVQPIFCNY